MPPHRPNKDLPCIKISCTFWSLSQPFTSSWSWGLSLNTGFWLSTSSLKTATSTSKWWNVFESKKPRKLRNNQTDTDDGFSANGAPCSSQLQKLITHISLLTWPDIIILNCKKELCKWSPLVTVCQSLRVLLAQAAVSSVMALLSNRDVSSLMNGSHPVPSPDWDHHTVLAGMWLMKRSDDHSFRFWIFPTVITDWFSLC